MANRWWEGKGLCGSPGSREASGPGAAAPNRACELEEPRGVWQAETGSLDLTGEGWGAREGGAGKKPWVEGHTGQKGLHGKSCVQIVWAASKGEASTQSPADHFPKLQLSPAEKGVLRSQFAWAAKLKRSAFSTVTPRKKESAHKGA